MNQQRLPNSNALSVQETIEEQTENIEVSERPSEVILNKEELIAAKVLYELANYTRGERISVKRKFEEDGLTSRGSRKRIEHSHEDFHVQDLSHKAIARTFSEFPFSIIHLLSAIRDALVTPLSLDNTLAYEYHPIHGHQPIIDRASFGIISHSKYSQRNLPSLTVDQISNRVRSKPGDFSILECKYPLVELVRGALKIFASETAPLGVTQWKPLTIYDGLSRTWIWKGPMPSTLTQENCTKVETSSTAWGISQENLVKIVDQYTIWLRGEQEILQHIARLPPFPLALMQVKDFHTRFNDRKRTNPNTISQSCDKIRAYFQREETIRYLIPNRTFYYTALDGKKSAVAPLQKNSKKASTKPRGHYVFKPNRPPQFSLLSLVRDAAARLPNNMGTRADICILVRDSQYVVENIPESAVKQVVSGALDRLHSEHDPCVEYNGKWGLWVYLHGDRHEEDFVDEGTSSSKTKNKDK
ncbi:hypothetical protein F511_11459 [Dorcoceras hygrometricum]|uniref:Nuclear factor related to kappa-B-binding protein second winged helix domain-containing protein n=1 Tax=Dorcoceras hygrometricum TaxID=472368 RepID=A0A2Z7CXP7_9LAMI|nr:hypothetical protein F511_11459 [Dorcoceras hygrometricum]